MQELNCPNIRFGTFELDIRDDGNRLDDFTSIIVISEEVSERKIRDYARKLIKLGCRDFAFCGVQADRWHLLFDVVDLDIAKSEEEYATTWSIGSIDEIPDNFCACKENVFIFCTDYELVSKCHSVVVNAGCGFKVKFICELDSVAYLKDKAYTVLSIEKGWYRVMSELDEDYLIPPEACVRLLD